MTHRHAHGTAGAAPETRGSVIHWAGLYDLLNKLPGMGHSSTVRSQAIDLAGLQPGEKVLDIGCGPGTLALLAVERVGPDGEVHGIDPSPEMIELARKKAAAAGKDVRFQTGVAEGLPFPDGTFDAVLSSLMLHHLPDDVRARALREVARVLRPGGRLFVVDMAGGRGGPWHWRLLSLFIRHRLPEDYVQRLSNTIAEAGLAPEVLDTGGAWFAFIRATKKGD